MVFRGVLDHLLWLLLLLLSAAESAPQYQELCPCTLYGATSIQQPQQQCHAVYDMLNQRKVLTWISAMQCCSTN